MLFAFRTASNKVTWLWEFVICNVTELQHINPFEKIVPLHLNYHIWTNYLGAAGRHVAPIPFLSPVLWSRAVAGEILMLTWHWKLSSCQKWYVQQALNKYDYTGGIVKSGSLAYKYEHTYSTAVLLCTVTLQWNGKTLVGGLLGSDPADICWQGDWSWQWTSTHYAPTLTDGTLQQMIKVQECFPPSVLAAQNKPVWFVLFLRRAGEGN